MAAQLGLPTLVVREVATYQVRGRFAELRGILTRTNQAVLVFSVALATVAWALFLG